MLKERRLAELVDTDDIPLLTAAEDSDQADLRAILESYENRKAKWWPPTFERYDHLDRVARREEGPDKRRKITPWFGGREADFLDTGEKYDRKAI